MAATAQEPTTPPPPARGHRWRAAGAVAVLVLLFLVLDVGYPRWTGRRADQAQTALYDTLEAAYAGTTSRDIDGLFVESFSPGDAGRFEDFFARAGGYRASALQGVDGGRGYQARYEITRSGQRRCVVATWRIDGLELDRRRGSACDPPDRGGSG